MFIYPSYRDLIDNIRKDYKVLFDFFKHKVKEILTPVIMSNFHFSDQEAVKNLEKRPEKSRYSKAELITESLIRGTFIYLQERKDILNWLKISNKQEREIIIEFSKRLQDFVKQLQERDIKPIAIITISLPNGLLKAKYIDKFVSGKDYSKSARYYYEDGIFEVIKEKTGENLPRVIFVDLNENYLNDLKKYFDKIIVLDQNLKKIK